MRSFQTILFDLDDTLIDFRKCEQLCLQECYDRFFANIVSYDVFAKDYHRINQSLWRQLERGEVTTPEISKLRFSKLYELYQKEYNPQVPEFFNQRLVIHSCWVDGAVDLLDSLKKNNHKIGFVTNGFAELQRGKYKSLGLFNYSDILVISEEVGVAKPAPKIFQHALGLIKSQPIETLMVGDSLLSDGAGAKNIGMPFCWYNPHKMENTKEWHPEYIIHHLKDF